MFNIPAMIAAFLTSAPVLHGVAGTPPCCADHGKDDHKADHAAADPKDAATAIDAVLDRIERSGAELRAFTAHVHYEVADDLLGRREIRTGEMIYRVDDAGAKSFAVLFDRLIIPPRAQNRQRHYIFSDRWLVEIDHAEKQFIKREIVAPGRQLDPLKLGEGPIPLPIGQPKDEVLARFEVSEVQPPEEGPLAGLDGVDGLRLTPKSGTAEAREYEHVDLFYDRATSLPVGIAAVEAGGNRKFVRLRDVAHNPKLTDEQLAKLSVEEPDPKEWAIDVQPWRGGN